MPNKLTTEDFILTCQNKGIDLGKDKNHEFVILDEYVNTSTKIKFFHTKCNREYFISPNKFRSNKYPCSLCSKEIEAKRQRRDLEWYLNECKKVRSDMHDYFISGTYDTNNSKLKFLHKTCNNTFKMAAKNFKNLKYKCPYCSGNKKISFNEIKEYVEDNGFIVLTKEQELDTLVSLSTKKLHLKCEKCNSDVKLSYSNIKNDNSKCYICTSNLNRFDYDTAKQLIKYYDTSSEYTLDNKNKDYDLNVHFPLHLIHRSREFGEHSCRIAWNNFKKGYRCSHCSRRKNSSSASLRIESYFIENEIKYITEYKRDDLVYKDNLRFDFYLPDYDIYIEYDGKQHFEKNSTSTIFKYEDSNKRDIVKNEYSVNNNLVLYRIPYIHDEISDIKRILIGRADDLLITKDNYLTWNEIKI